MLRAFIHTAILLIMVSPTISAETYNVKIQKISQKVESGDVVIKIKPAENEDGFTGKARVMILNTDYGATESLSTVLTAISMSADVGVITESGV